MRWWYSSTVWLKRPTNPKKVFVKNLTSWPRLRQCLFFRPLRYRQLVIAKWRQLWDSSPSSLAREIRVINSAGGDDRKTSCHENQASSKFICFYGSFECVRYPILASKTVELLLKAWPPVSRPKLSLESTCRLVLSTTKCIQNVY